jgi:HEAT repeat protein
VQPAPLALLAGLALACRDPAPAAVAPPADLSALEVQGQIFGDPAQYAARGAPTAAAEWSGSWSVLVLASDPEGPGASALAAALGQRPQRWQGSLPPSRPGEIVVIWLEPSDGSPVLQPVPGAPPPRGRSVAVLGPGDADWAGEQAQRLPWAGLGVLDATASTGLWADPAIAVEQPALGAQLIARSLSERFALPYTPPASGGSIPGLAQHLRPEPTAGLADPRARAAAARGDPDPALATDPEPAVRLALAAASDDQAVLARLAGDREPLVRARAADRIEDLALLAELAGDPSSVVRLMATHSISRLAQAGRAEAGPVLADIVRDSPDAYQRWKAAWGLGGLTGWSAALVPLLSDPDVDVRREAATALARQGDPQALEPLLACLDDPDSFLRITAARALGELGDPGAIPGLNGALEDPAQLVVGEAARALQRLGVRAGASRYHPPTPPGSVAALAALLSDSDPTVRKDAAKFAAGSDESTGLLGPLLTDGDPEVRKAAASALGWSPGGAPLLLPLLDDPDLDVVVTATEALRRCGGFDPQALLPLLQHPDAELRLRAAEALAAAGPHPGLEALAEDPDERIRAAWARAYPQAVSSDDPSALVRRVGAAADPGRFDSDPSALVRYAASGSDANGPHWARGVIAGEDDLLHLRFSFHDEDEIPRSHQSLRPPVVREYGHPDRG